MRNFKIALIIILLATALYSGVKAGCHLYDGYINKGLNEKLRNDFHRSEEAIGEISAELTDEYIYKEKFMRLKKINDDITGWIHVPGTEIDYPVARGSDNSYYLKHGIDKKRSARGSLFMDYRNLGIGQDFNTVIYGHNMKDGSMFGDLVKYKEASFFYDHSLIEYVTEQGMTTWKIFSIYIYRGEDDFFNLGLGGKDHYGEYILDCAKRSLYDADVDVKEDDIILSLLTCTYEYDNARLVIHAKLIDS